MVTTSVAVAGAAVVCSGRTRVATMNRLPRMSTAAKNHSDWRCVNAIIGPSILLRSPACLHLFEPCDDPLIFTANLTGMKCEHPLLCLHSCTRLIGQLLQIAEIL